MFNVFIFVDWLRGISTEVPSGACSPGRIAPTAKLNPLLAESLIATLISKSSPKLDCALIFCNFWRADPTSSEKTSFWFEA